MYNEMMHNYASALDFLDQAYREGTRTYPGPSASERSSHNAVHAWVRDPEQPSNEDLRNFYSAGRDPPFYCHQSNVYRMWIVWQDFLPNNKIPDKKITDPDYHNASFLFYDKNAQLVRVIVKDTFDTLWMGYDYEILDLPWLDYRPLPQTAGAKVTRAVMMAVKAEIVSPLKLDKIVRVLVPKTAKGKVDELLVLEDITMDTSKFLKFDVFVNNEDDNVGELNKAAYAGTYSQVPHKTMNQTATTFIRLKLTDLYDDMDVSEDDTILGT